MCDERSERTSFAHFFDTADTAQLAIPADPSFTWVELVCRERARQAGTDPEQWVSSAPELLSFLRAIAKVQQSNKVDGCRNATFLRRISIMWMAYLQHNPEDVAYGFGDSAQAAAEALVAAYPTALGDSISVTEVSSGKGVASQEDFTTQTIVIGAKGSRTAGNPRW